jgi:hypothetical protein
MILLIPFIAKRVVSGDVGSTMLAVVGVAAGAVQAAVAGWAGMQAGAASAAGGDGGGGGGGGGGVLDAHGGSNHSPSPPPEGNAVALSGEAEASGHSPQPPGGAAMVDANSAGGSGAAAAASDDRPPNDSPWQSHGRPGHFGHYNIPHAIGWTVGTWAGATRRTVSSAFRSSQNDQLEEG